MREYNDIPKIYKSYLTKDFLMLFKSNLEQVFHRNFSKADDWYYEHGTNGWHRALNMTCTSKGHPDIIYYYDSLDWMDSDAFDADLTDIATEILNLEKLNPNDLEDGEDNE